MAAVGEDLLADLGDETVLEGGKIVVALGNAERGGEQADQGFKAGVAAWSITPAGGELDDLEAQTVGDFVVGRAIDALKDKRDVGEP